MRKYGRWKSCWSRKRRQNPRHCKILLKTGESGFTLNYTLCNNAFGVIINIQCVINEKVMVSWSVVRRLKN